MHRIEIPSLSHLNLFFLSRMTLVFSQKVVVFPMILLLLF